MDLWAQGLVGWHPGPYLPMAVPVGVSRTRGPAGLSGTFLLEVCVSLLAAGATRPQAPTSPSQRSSLPPAGWCLPAGQS